MIDFSLLHFIRPWAWWLFPVLLITGWWFVYNRAQTVEWKNYIDEHLASWLLDNARRQKKKSFLWPLLFIFSAFLLSFSAAGPSWEKQPVAISSITSKAIIVLDLSPSMVVEDISPSRLGRARFKILEILKQWKQGYVGLVAFAEDGFIISPLTDDAETIANMVKVLTPAIMPGEGAAADSGIRMALDLLRDSEILQVSGDILLITDGVSTARSYNIQQILDQTSVRLSVLSIGTKQGAPIPSQQTAGFITDSSGAIVIAKLDNAPLIKLALSFDGLFLSSKASNEDILSWLNLLQSDFDNQTDKIEDKKIERWVDQGAIFLLPILILMAFVFRKGLLFSLLIFTLYIPENNLYAATTKTKEESKQQDLSLLEDSLWDSLWYNNAQLGDNKMKAGRPELALQNYTQPQKVAEALYRAGLYKQAADVYASLTGANARHNQGNAQAQNRQLEEAIKSYKEALEQQPDFEAARKNLQTVEELLKQQQQQEQQEQDDKNKQDNKDKKDDKNKQNDKKNSEQDKKDQKDQDQQNKENQQNDDNKDSEENPPEQEQQEQQDKQQSEDQKNNQQQEQQQKPMTAEEKEAEKQKQQMIEQWLRQINDDPSRLLRNKLILEQRRREQSGNRPKQDNKEW